MASKFEGFDSDEEQYFVWYCEELKQAGILLNYFYHQAVFDLIPGYYYNTVEQKPRSQKQHTYTLAQPHGYKPDFLLIWNKDHPSLRKFTKVLYGVSSNYFNSDHKDLKNYFWCQLHPQVYSSYVDIKPIHSKRESDIALFSWKRALMLLKYGIHVQAIVVQDLFKKTFTPRRYLKCDISKKPRKINFPILTLEGVM